MKATSSLLSSLLLISACTAASPDAATEDAVGAHAAEAADERQAEVAARGAGIMPFDLDRSTHVFATTDEGGVQTVRSDDGDAEQVELIRAHLREEAVRFARGDFHDPAMIHGAEMPGLHTLVMGTDRLTVEYRDVERGGEIRYSSADPDLIITIHEWFAAQLSDHGEHAQGSHGDSGAH